MRINIIPFTKAFLPCLIVSAILIIIGLTSYTYRGGLNLGIDFSSGLLLKVSTPEKISSSHLIHSLDKKYPHVDVQTVKVPQGSVFSIRIKVKQNDPQFSQQVISTLNQNFPQLKVLQSSFISPSFSQDLVKQSIYIVSIALILILIYIWIRFRLFFALAAIISLAHDLLLLLGVIFIFHMDFTVTSIAALLTILGYSLNDTIVIFDRIRQYLRQKGQSNLAAVINEAITRTLSRTLITSFVTLVSIVAIAVLTKGDVQNFAILFIIGIVVGTYSSIGIASATFYYLKKNLRKPKHSVKKKNLNLEKN